MTTLTFNDVNFHPVAQNDGQIWLTSAELAKALGYSRTDKISNLYSNHKDEFTDKMTLTLKMGVKGFGNGNSEKDVRIFSLRGCHLLAMFAKTEIAKKFRVWVLNILDKEVGQPVIEPVSTLSTTQDRKPLVKAVEMLVEETGAIFSNVWRMVWQRFNVISVEQLTIGQVKEAIEYIHSLFLQTVKMNKSTQSTINTNPNAPYAEKFRVVGREANDDSRRRLNFVAKQLDEAQRQMRALLALNGLTYDCFVEVNSGFVMTPEQRQEGRKQAKEMLEAYKTKGLISKTNI